MLKISDYNTFWYVRMWDIPNFYLQALKTIDYVHISLLLKNVKTSRLNNLKILWIKNVKFSGTVFFQGDFQICSTVTSRSFSMGGY